MIAGETLARDRSFPHIANKQQYHADYTQIPSILRIIMRNKNLLFIVIYL
jgi:hypothetical protein